MRRTGPFPSRCGALVLHLFALCMTLLGACSPSIDTLQVSADKSSIAAGTTVALVATATLSDQTTQDLTSAVTWTSADPTVATISNTPGSRGLVTAVAKGTVVLTAKHDPSERSGTFTLTVTDATVTSVAITPPVAAIAKGTAQDFTATATFSNGTSQDVTALAVWSTPDTTIAKLGDQGKAQLTAQGLIRGVATIRAAFGDRSSTASLVVTDAALTKLAVSPEGQTVAKGTSLQFTATGTFSDNTTQDLTTLVTWASMDATVASISNDASRGKAAALKKGQTTISASFNGQMASTALTVSDASLVSVAVTPPSLVLAKGTSQKLAATGTFSDGSTQDLTTTASWTTSAMAVATVSNTVGSEGVVSAVTRGSATITATSGGKSGTASVTVTDATLTGLALSPQAPALAKGTTLQLTATGTYSDNSTQDVTSLVTWASTDATIAAVSNAAGSRGLLTGVAKGATTITATLGAQNQSVNVTVSDATLSTITVSPPAPAIAKGTTQAFTATGVYSDGSTQDLTATVAWSSGTPAVATISNAAADRGTATGVAKGTSIITATTGGKSGTATLNVTDATLTGLTVNPQAPALAKGTTLQLTATGTYSDNSTQDLTSSVAWTSADATVAAVSNSAGSRGLLTGVAKGTTTVTATLGGQTQTVTVTVSDATLSTITVTPAAPAIAKGTKQAFTASGTYSDGSTQDLTATVSWTSGTPAVATISNAAADRGTATGIAKGSSVITATTGGKSGTATLNVTDATLTGLTVTPATPTVPQATRQQFVATGTYSDGSTQEVTSLCTWSSSDTAIATISNLAGSRGLATTGNRGVVTITAVLGALNNTATMTVVLPTITNLRYAAPVEYAVGALAAGPVIGDLNGDGKPDVVISDINANTVIFFKGNGDGTFTRGASIGSGASQPYTNTKPVDLNGDGKLDVIASNYASGSVSVFLGNGNGTLQAPTLLSSGASVFGAAVGLLNGDNLPDLVTSNIAGTTLGLRLATGPGVFPAATTPLTTVTTPDNLTIADINGDGKLDLVNISSGGNNLGLLLGNGNGTFQAVRSINVGNLTYGDVVAGDWNGDGKLDLAVTNNTSTQVLRGDGTGGFGAPVSYTAGGVTLITADLDNDGKADLASASANQVNLLLGNGDGTFKTVVRFPTGSGPYRMTSADLNNDGKIDLLVSTSGNFSVLMNTSM